MSIRYWPAKCQLSYGGMKVRIREYIAQGGGLVASYEAGMYDEAGRRTAGVIYRRYLE